MREQFPDALSAIRAACRLAGSPGRPLAARMVGPSSGEAGDWTDAAARAGFVWQALRPLSGPPIAALVARVAPQWKPCSCRRRCCSGRARCFLWWDAVNILAAGALCEGMGWPYAERFAMIANLYAEERLTYKLLGERLSLNRETVSERARRVEKWLGSAPGARAGVEPTALRNAQTLLSDAGMLLA